MANQDSSLDKSLGQHNQDHFDSVAKSAYDIEWVRKLVNQITAFLQGNTEWLGLPAPTDGDDRKIRMLDYACGNGTYSLALSQHVTTLRGIDISGKMVDEYNVAAQSPEQMHAVQGDLLDDAANAKLQDPDLFNFDLILMSMALHHVHDTAKMVRVLAERLAPGGTLVIVDWVAVSESGCGCPPASEHGNKFSHIVAHQGFTTQTMHDLFGQAGLVRSDVRRLEELSDMPAEVGGPQQLFFAKAVKTRQ